MANLNLTVNVILVLGTALVGAAIAARLRQSVILGYILAGVVVSPFTPGPVGDIEAVRTLADVGIILLMFTVGVQLSLRDLLRVGGVATAAALAQVLILLAIGYQIGVALGWRPLEALFFGGVISNSSSTVLGKVLGERGEMDAPHGHLGLAWSSIQDLSTVVMVVVFSTLAVGSERLMEDLIWALAKAAGFLTLFGTLGYFALPWLFERVATLRNREVFLLTVVVIAMGTAYLASLFGLSLALGAFVAGVVVGESDLSHQILGEIVPFRDLFAGLFFVSVGMLLDPSFVAQHPLLVVLTVALIVVVKGAVVSGLSFLFRYPVRTALLTGVALAQSAEFSFLLASVGADLGVVTPPVFSLLLAGAVTSIALAPVLYRLALPVAQRVEQLWQSSLDVEPVLLEKELRGHAVICGYGRVGRVIGRVLQRRRLSFVVIDQDQRVVRRLREEGVVALLGNAAHPVLLERAGVRRARVLVIAVPDALAVRQIVEHARQLNPSIDIVARTHSLAEAEFLRERGVREAVVGELELALEMMRHTLSRFGVSPLEILNTVQRWRERVETDHDGQRIE
ncbi:MAG TPA: cation:proton antiporter [Chloroflexota bacterium]